MNATSVETSPRKSSLDNRDNISHDHNYEPQARPSVTGRFFKNVKTSIVGGQNRRHSSEAEKYHEKKESGFWKQKWKNKQSEDQILD